MATTTAGRSKRQRSYSSLFFLKRRPRLRGVPLEWEHPGDEDAYQHLIDKENFVSSRYWHNGELDMYPTVKQDADDLAEYLLPTFFQFSQKASYYQNQFYLYQWVFVIGAFLTTVCGALATLLYIPPNLSIAATAAAERSIEANMIDWQQVMSAATAVIAAITGVVTALSNRNEPQKRWGKARRLTEELRMHYFTYLSHLPPYDTANRLRVLRENVVNFRMKEQENG
ncbi:MAG: DUF4231 domain-containing protein [Anaerolineae bacterium]